MIFTIADGSSADINVGMFIRVKSGVLPAEFENKAIEVTQVDANYPYFFDGYQDSAIDPELITEYSQVGGA